MTIVAGALLAGVFVLTLDDVAGVMLLATAATAAAAVARKRPVLFVATLAIWLELGVLVLFVD